MREAISELKGFAQGINIHTSRNPSMRRIREVLLNEYIGAITIGLLLAYAASGIVSSVVQPLIRYLYHPRTQESIYGNSRISFSSFLPPLVSVILYLFLAYLILYWLYLRPIGEIEKETNADSEPLSSDEAGQP